MKQHRLRLGSRQERLLRSLSKRYQGLTDTMRHAGLTYQNDGYVLRSLHKKGLVIVSDHTHVGDRVIKITEEGKRRLNSARNLITSQDLLEEMPAYFGMRQRQALRLFRRTPVLKTRDVARRLGLNQRFVERIVAKLYRYQFITDIDRDQYVMIQRGLDWLDDDCAKRGIKRYPPVEE